MNNWFVHPTRRIVILAVLGWLLGCTSLVLSGALFGRSGFLLLLMLAAALGALIRLVMNYSDADKGY